VAGGVMAWIEEQQNTNLVETDLTEVVSEGLGSYLVVRGFFGIVRFVGVVEMVSKVCLKFLRRFDGAAIVESPESFCFEIIWVLQIKSCYFLRENLGLVSVYNWGRLVCCGL